MKKIVFLEGSGHGGAEHMTIQYAKILMSHGYTCSALILQQKRSQNKIQSYIPKRLRHEVGISRYRWMIFRIYKFLRKEKPNAVFCSMPDISILLLLLKIIGLYKGKTIIRESNMPSRQPKRTRRFAKILYPKANILIAQTLEMKKEMIQTYGVSAKKVKVINNPTDEETIKKAITIPFQFDCHFVNYVTVGRIAKQKDYITALRAFSEVLKVQPNSRYYIIGGDSDSEYVALVHQEVERLGIMPNVFFEGFQNNPYKYDYGCDVFVLSSIFEGLPNAMLDAMYLGCPVVATECIPYIKKIVHNGENGYTVKVGDYKALAEAMIKATQIKRLHKFIPVNNSTEQILNIFEK